VGHVDISLHLPRVIINSMQTLCAQSHLQITHRKAQFHVLFEDVLDDRNAVPKVVLSSFSVLCSKISGRYPLRTNLLHLEYPWL